MTTNYYLALDLGKASKEGANDRYERINLGDNCTSLNAISKYTMDFANEDALFSNLASKNLISDKGKFGKRFVIVYEGKDRIYKPVGTKIYPSESPILFKSCANLFSIENLQNKLKEFEIPINESGRFFMTPNDKVKLAFLEHLYRELDKDSAYFNEHNISLNNAKNDLGNYINSIKTNSTIDDVTTFRKDYFIKPIKNIVKFAATRKDTTKNAKEGDRKYNERGLFELLSFYSVYNNVFMKSLAKKRSEQGKDEIIGEQINLDSFINMSINEVPIDPNNYISDDDRKPNTIEEDTLYESYKYYVKISIERELDAYMTFDEYMTALGQEIKDDHRK